MLLPKALHSSYHECIFNMGVPRGNETSNPDPESVSATEPQDNTCSQLNIVAKAFSQWVTFHSLRCT